VAAGRLPYGTVATRRSCYRDCTTMGIVRRISLPVSHHLTTISDMNIELRTPRTQTSAASLSNREAHACIYSHS
jgi:hypothetical protein